MCRAPFGWGHAVEDLDSDEELNVVYASLSDEVCLRCGL